MLQTLMFIISAIVATVSTLAPGQHSLRQREVFLLVYVEGNPKPAALCGEMGLSMALWPRRSVIKLKAWLSVAMKET